MASYSRSGASSYTAKQRQLEPFPVAVNVIKTDGTQPIQLGRDVEQDIAWVFIISGCTDARQEACVEGRRWRGNMFQIAEDAAR